MTVGTESRRRSARVLIFDLKLPATILQSSPSASRDEEASEVDAPPSMRAANLAEVALAQRRVVMPQSAPAMPTMAVCSPVGSPVLAELSSGRTPTIISKTSTAAHSRMVFQLGSNATAIGDEGFVAELIGHLRGAA